MSDEFDFSDLELDWLNEPSASGGAPAFPGTEDAGTPASETDIDKILAEIKGTAGHTPRTQPRPAQPRPQSAQPRAAAPRPRPQQAQPQQTQQRPPQPRPAAAQPRRTAVPQEPERIYDRQASARSAGTQGTHPRRPAPEPDYESQVRNNRRGRRGGMSNKLLIALIAVLVLGLIIAGWQLASIFRNYHRDRSAYEDLANNAIVRLAEPDEKTGDADAPQSSAGTVNSGNGGHAASEIPLSVDWEYLRSINANIVGWLYCPDTVINYPVVQTSDQEFYLKHGFDGNPNNSGTLFADPASVPGITQSNYIIYGHNMKDESMFGTFKYYVERSYYDKHPVMYYLTPNGSYRIDLVCARVAESYVENLPGYFSTASDYQSYINEISSDAFWVNYDALTTDLQLFSMSTCTTAAGIEDARFLLYGVMTPIQ